MDRQFDTYVMTYVSQKNGPPKAFKQQVECNQKGLQRLR